MPVVIINPNSTAAMTDAMLATARAAAPSLDFEGWTSDRGPPSIQGAEDGRAATAPLLDLVAKARDAGVNGIVVGCFDDTALADAAALAPCPVIGIGQAAFHACALRQWRFSVVTTLSVSVPVIESNIARYGLAGLLGRVRASEVPVLDLDQAPEAAVAPILGEAERAVLEDDIGALVLGCAGMVHVAAAVRAVLPIPVIDPVEAAAASIAWLCDLTG
ncbi:MAG: aspartate/glutamate racemase family protein [Rhodobacter sp.]|nr:aspartate/glutamate racemase family protein [Rhodobacter sp.]